jgi:hypothetical protein
LHASLLFFFAGLVAFLIPVHTVVTVVAAALLGILMIVFSLFTVFPLILLDCPYRTPLSVPLWNMTRYLANQFHRFQSEPGGTQTTSEEDDDTMVESVFRRAIKSSPERDVRDERALVWTMKSLIDHTELEPYVDVLHGPNGRHFLYEDHIKALINHSDIDIALLDRIHDLHSSCFSGILPPELAKRRKILLPGHMGDRQLGSSRRFCRPPLARSVCGGDLI